MRSSWTYDEIREAFEKSRAALLNLTSTSASHDLDLINLTNVENLFLLNLKEEEIIELDELGCLTIGSYAKEKHVETEWGSRDMMLDFSDDTTIEPQQRMAILKAAANLTGRTVHLLDLSLTQEEENFLVEALSLAADRDAGPSSLLIKGVYFRDAHGLLSALQRNKRLKHLSLQCMEINDMCVEVFSDFPSLTSLHLEEIEVYPKDSSKEEFVGRLAELHPSYSPLAASLQRLYIDSFYPGINWRRCTGFLRHWSKLRELFLCDDRMREELTNFMDHLTLPKKGAEEVGSSTPSSSPQLYSLQIGKLDDKELSRSTTAAVVDALSRSGLPFFGFIDRYGLIKALEPAIEAQLWRNQRNYMLGSDLKRVPATSIRLFICGDPFAGKTTLVSTMRSIYGRKRDRARALLTTLFTGERTKGIEVQAINKEGINVSVWDMAGQQEFHAFHDFMFPDIGTTSYQFPSMFMFVWSPMTSENKDRGERKKNEDFQASFRYWLRFLASKSRQSIIPLKVILVFTRADQMELVSSSLSESINSLRSEFKRVIDIVNPPFDVDARNKDSVKPVAEHILNIAKDVLHGIELYDICTQVRKNLLNYSKSTKEQIITWEEFTTICNNDANAKLNAIAMSLNESGNIIYISRFKHIILDPHWFCNKVIGSLIGFPMHGESKGMVGFENGCIPRNFLEQSITKSKAMGSLLVDLMEAMHLCCKVPKATTNLIFIPAILPDVGVQQLQWSRMDDNDTFVYMGRRLECENKDLTFLTPGLFPRIQALFSNAFQSKDFNVDITLGKDFITICLPKSEIIIVFCQVKSNHVIDVLIQNDQNIDTKKETLRILAFVEKRIIKNLIQICAQPTGVQGVTLIESVIRPDCLRYPSKAQDREDKCIEITYLKKQLKRKLKRGEIESYDWKRTRHMPHPLSNDLIDLLGSEYYGEVLEAYKKWFEVKVRGALLEIDEIVNESRNYRSRENVIKTSLENGLVQEDQLISEEPIEVQSTNNMVRSILSLHRKMDATHEVVLKLNDKMSQMTNRLDEIHRELQCMKKDTINKVEKSVSMLLKMALENEVENQLPRVALLMTKSPTSTVEKILEWVPEILGGKILRIQLYCEHKNLPHPVENQLGITLTSLSEFHSEYLDKALPYINAFFNVLTIAARLEISSVAPFASSFIPDWTPHLKLAKQYPMIQSALKSEKDMYSLSTLNSSSKEWQKCLASILMENGGLTDQNIATKFCLQRAVYYEADGSTRVAWLCKTHYRGQQPFPLG